MTKLNICTSFMAGYVDDDNESGTDNFTMEYSVTAHVTTCKLFTETDELYTRIKSGNASDHWVDKGQGTYLQNAKDNGDVVKVDKIWYCNEISPNFKFFIGPKIENYYMVGVNPSKYPNVAKAFQHGINGSAYGSSTSPGFGFNGCHTIESGSKICYSLNYTSKDGADSSKGLLNDENREFIMGQLGWVHDMFDVSLALGHKSAPATSTSGYNSYAHSALAKATKGDQDTLGIRANICPENLPTITIAWDSSSYDSASAGEAQETQGWMIGLGFNDLIQGGSVAGIAFGTREHATKINGGGSDFAEDSFTMEVHVEIPITESFSIRPALIFGSDVEAKDKDYTAFVVEVLNKVDMEL